MRKNCGTRETIINHAFFAKCVKIAALEKLL